MSPEFHGQKEKKAEDQATSEIITSKLSRYETSSITEKYLLPPVNGKEQFMGYCENVNEKIGQSLRGIIKVGPNEFISIVDVKSGSEDGLSISDNTILTRHIAGQRAEFINFLDKDKPLAIGRTEQPYLEKTVSRSHFFVAQGMDGSIGIVDNKSTNGTEIYTPTVDNNLFMDENLLNMKDPSDPVYDYNFWSVKSGNIKNMVAKHEADKKAEAQVA